MLLLVPVLVAAAAATAVPTTDSLHYSVGHPIERSAAQSDAHNPVHLFGTSAIAVSGIPADEQPTIGFELDTTIVHGTCNFHLQLFQECISTPSQQYEKQTLGFLFGIQDGSGNTVVRYLEGVGRFDGLERTKHLTNIGGGPDLYTVFYTDEKVHFRYDQCIWDSDTKTDTGLCGRCESWAWTKGDLGCSKESVGGYRLQDINCFFKC